MDCCILIYIGFTSFQRPNWPQIRKKTFTGLHSFSWCFVLLQVLALKTTFPLNEILQQPIKDFYFRCGFIIHMIWVFHARWKISFWYYRLIYTLAALATCGFGPSQGFLMDSEQNYIAPTGSADKSVSQQVWPLTKLYSVYFLVKNHAPITGEDISYFSFVPATPSSQFRLGPLKGNRDNTTPKTLYLNNTLLTEF